MEGDPFVLIEGMTIAGFAVGATSGYIYLRSEYPHAFRTHASARSRSPTKRATWARTSPAAASTSISRFAWAPAPTSAARRRRCSKAWKASAARSAPSRRCPRSRACSASRPSSTTSSRWRPCRSSSTRAREYYANFGMGRSRGTLTIQLAGNIKHGGLVEKAFGLTLREAIYDFGGGTATGRPFRAVQVGGPLGAYFPESLLDTPLDYEAFAAKKGHGRPRRHRGLRRHRRSCQASPLRHGILRHRELRQVHALPHRLDARRRGDRPDHRQPGPHEESAKCWTIFAN